MIRPISRLITLVIGATCCSVVMAQSPAPTPVAPVGPWSVDYAEHGCTLARNFGSGANLLRLSILQSAEPIQSSVAVSGVGLAELGRPSGTVITDGENRSPTEFFLSVPQTSDGTAGMSGVVRSIAWADGDIRNVTAEIRNGNRLLRLLSLEGFGPAMDALRTCQRNLWQQRGYDADALARVRVQAEPDGSPARWVTPNDLPRPFYRMSGAWTVAVWLHVGVDGRPTRCEIGQSSGEELLDLQACRVLMARARFRPARDADGVPVATIHQRRISWQAPPHP